MNERDRRPQAVDARETDERDRKAGRRGHDDGAARSQSDTRAGSGRGPLPKAGDASAAAGESESAHTDKDRREGGPGGAEQPYPGVAQPHPSAHPGSGAVSGESDQDVAEGRKDD